MSSLSRKIYNEFREQLGAELKCVRLEQNLTLEEAANLFNQPHKNLITDIECGRSKRLFLIFVLCALYGKHLKIELVD